MPGNELFPIINGAAEALPNPDSANGGVLSDVWHGLIGDKVAAWRLKNAAELNEKLGRELAERGQTINLDNIPERFAFSWFEKATQEDEADVQKLFVRLLSNAAEGNSEALERRNIDIVSKMSASDARLLKHLVITKTYAIYRRPDTRFVGKWTQPGLANEIAHSDDLDLMAIEHLVLLGVLEAHTETVFDNTAIIRALEDSDSGQVTFPDLNRAQMPMRTISMTPIGRSLCDALFHESGPSEES